MKTSYLWVIDYIDSHTFCQSFQAAANNGSSKNEN